MNTSILKLEKFFLVCTIIPPLFIKYTVQCESQNIFKQSRSLNIKKVVLDYIGQFQDTTNVEMVVTRNISEPGLSQFYFSNSTVAVTSNEFGIALISRENNHNIFLVMLMFHEDKSSFYENFDTRNNIVNNTNIDLNNLNTFWIFLQVWPEILEDKNEANFILDKILHTNYLHMNKNVFAIFISNEGTTHSVHIWEMYFIKTKRIIAKVELISFNGNRRNWNELTRKIPRRTNFQEETIIAIAGDDLDYDWEAKFVDDKSVSILESGSAVHMFWVLRDTLNFSIRGFRGSWIEEFENDSLGGLAIELLNGQADICISLMPLTAQTGKYLTFLQPTEVDTIRAFFVQPANSAIRDIYLNTYTSSLKVTCFVVFMGLFISIRVIIWVQTQRAGWLRFCESDLADESLLWTMATLCQQGWYNTPYFGSTKTVFITGYFTGLICYIAFSAAIVSKFSVDTKPISRFEDLISFDYVLFADKDTGPYQFILPDIPKKQMRSMENEGIDLSEALNRIVKSKSALLSYDDVLLMSSRNIQGEYLLCKTISSLPATKKDVPFSMLVKRGSPFREFFNQKITFMKERGLNKRFDMLYNDGIKLTCAEKTTTKKQLGLQDLFGAFITISSAFPISLVVLMTERLWKIIFNDKKYRDTML